MARFPLPPAHEPLSPRWGSSAFAAELSAWVGERVGPVRLESVKLRAWAAVWRATGEDRAWFVKENCPASRFEGALVSRLGALVPEHVVRVQELDPDTGRFLTADQGATLGFGDDLAVWRLILGQYAELQRALLAHTADLADLGVEPLAVADSEELVRDRIVALHQLPAGDPARLDDDGRRASRTRCPRCVGPWTRSGRSGCRLRSTTATCTGATCSVATGEPCGSSTGATRC
jgi:hypothetical protein